MYRDGLPPPSASQYYPLRELAEKNDARWWQESALQPFQLIRSDRYEQQVESVHLEQQQKNKMTENAHKRRKLEEAAAKPDAEEDNFLRRQQDQDAYTQQISKGKSGIYSGRDETIPLEEQLIRSGFNPKVIQLINRKELNLGPTDNPRDYLPELHEYLTKREEKEGFLKERSALRNRQVDEQSLPDHVKKLAQATKEGQPYEQGEDGDDPSMGVASVGQQLGGQFAAQKIGPVRSPFFS